MTLGVMDEVRGLRIGQRLMEEVEESVGGRRERVELHVVEYNRGARRFY